MSIAPKNNFDETICTNLINKENKRINRQCSVGAQNNGGARVPMDLYNVPKPCANKEVPYTAHKNSRTSCWWSSLQHDENAGKRGLSSEKEEVGVCNSVEWKGFIQGQPCFRKDRLSFSAILASTLAAHRIPLWSYQTQSGIHCPLNMSAWSKRS